MTNFVYDNVALPADKIDSGGGSAAVSNPTRRWVPNDANRVFTALTDIRKAVTGETLNVTAFGAVGNGTTDDYTAIQAAITAAAATVSGGFGAWVLFPKGTFITGTKLVLPNGVGLMGAGPSMTTLKAKSTFNDTALVTNQLQAGTQEFAFLRDMLITGNKGNGAVCSVAVVDWVSLFVNSYISNCIIEEGSNVGLRIAADGTPGGMGPIYVENCWVARNTGHNVYVEDTVANTGAATNVVFVNLTSENQGTGKSAIYLKGNGRLAGVRFIGATHLEMGDATKTSKTGVTFDGCSHSAFDNLTILGAVASITEGINILNVAQNVGIKIEHIYNPNLINPVIRDQKNSVTIGAVNVNHYVTADWTYQGSPRYLPPSASGKSVVFQNSAGANKAWFDGAGQLTGDSTNGAGLDVVSSEGATNDRALTIVNFAKDRVFGWNFPVGGGGVSRFRYITGGVDIMQFGTDGTVFHYESPTFQKTATFQQGLRLSAEISPAQITANQNNYNPTGLSTAVVMLLTSDASRDITGIAAQSSGVLWVYNIGAQNLVLKHQDANSTAANRIIGTAGADVTLTPNRCALLRYSAAQTRWLVMTDNL